MRSFSLFNRRAGSLFGAATLVFATLIPALASAATVTDRSVTLSSSVKAAAGVTYEVKFKAQDNSTGAFVLEFCTNPTIGTSCTAPSGVSTSGVGTSGSDTVSAVNINKAVKVVLASSANAGDSVDVVLTGIHNPTDSGVFYARIVTYQDGTSNYNYTDATTLGAHLGEGSVALSMTDGFGVSGAVPETMTFCASNAAITQADCSDATTPSISLGTAGILDTSLSTGIVYTQISTNAAKGAVVNLRSDATGCGGLVRQGATTNAAGCGIAPLTSAGSIGTGAAKFGVKLANLSATTGTIAVSGSYDTTNYYMNYVSGDASGVTGPYGDPVYNTSNAPVDLGKANLTFGANISNVTPAGTYKANFSLIATGTF